MVYSDEVHDVSSNWEHLSLVVHCFKNSTPVEGLFEFLPHSAIKVELILLQMQALILHFKNSSQTMDSEGNTCKAGK